MARIEQNRIPPRPSARTDRVDRVRNKAREIEALHKAPGEAQPEEPAVEAPRAREVQSIAAPGPEYLEPLVGMSRDRMVGSLSRIENVLARMQERGGTDGAADEVTLARMMINEHLRRLRLVEDERSAGR